MIAGSHIDHEVLVPPRDVLACFCQGLAVHRRDTLSAGYRTTQQRWGAMSRLMAFENTQLASGETVAIRTFGLQAIRNRTRYPYEYSNETTSSPIASGDAGDSRPNQIHDISSQCSSIRMFSFTYIYTTDVQVPGTRYVVYGLLCTTGAAPEQAWAEYGSTQRTNEGTRGGPLTHKHVVSLTSAFLTCRARNPPYMSVSSCP